MSLIASYKIETENDKIVYATCSKLLQVYNSATNQNLSYEFNKDYIISQKSDSSDILNLFWYFNYHTVDMLCEKENESVLSYYILGMLNSRLEEVQYLDKSDIHRKNYIKTLYNLISNFNFSFLSDSANIKDSNNKLNTFKNKFEILYKSWL